MIRGLFSLHSDSIITLTTDFGTDGPYVSAMKGVVLGLNPAARLVDLCHHIPPQDLRHAAYFLQQTIPYFPRGVLHVVVVDPGVGSERALLLVEADGHRLLVPDNGCWTWLDGPVTVRRLTEDRSWRQPVSATFHGRDILAPVAAHLSLGVSAEALSVPMEDWVRLPKPALLRTTNGVAGEVVFVDSFGNLLTNIPADALPTTGLRVHVGEHVIGQRVRTYAEAEPGSVVVLLSSASTLEIAVPHGSAARELRVTVGARVDVRW